MKKILIMFLMSILFISCNCGGKSNNNKKENNIVGKTCINKLTNSRSLIIDSDVGLGANVVILDSNGTRTIFPINQFNAAFTIESK